MRRLLLWGLTAGILAGAFAAKDVLATTWVRTRLKHMALPIELERVSLSLSRQAIEVRGLQFTVERPSASAFFDVDRLWLQFDLGSVFRRRPGLKYVLCEVDAIEVIREAEPRAAGAGETAEILPDADEAGAADDSGTAPAASGERLPIRRLDLRIATVRYLDKTVSAEYQQLPLNYAATFENIEHPRLVLQDLLAKPVMGRPLSDYFGWDVVL